MLKSSRTWPSILTMAVVQLKFDQKGKYSYSTIASPSNYNNSNIANNENQDEPNNLEIGGDDDKLCRHVISTTNSVSGGGQQTRSLSSSSTSPAHNSAVNCPSKNNTKICLCELEFRENRTKRSHSINVENWQLIYRENPASSTKEVIGSNGHGGNYPK